MTKKKEESFQLSAGSYYLVRSLESRDKALETRGEFRGYVSMGQETAIVIELDESHGEDRGRLRYIPLHMILCVEVLRTVETRDEPKEQTEAVYFG